MFKASDLARRDFISVIDGRRLGPITDMHIDDGGRVQALVLRNGRKFFGLFNRGRDLVVPWDQIKKIGVHAVLVEVGDKSEANRFYYQRR